MRHSVDGIDGGVRLGCPNMLIRTVHLLIKNVHLLIKTVQLLSRTVIQQNCTLAVEPHCGICLVNLELRPNVDALWVWCNVKMLI